MNNPADNNPMSSAPANAANIPGSAAYGRSPYNPAGMNYGMAAAGGSFASGRKLIIGEGIQMSGEIEHCDHLLVEGTVQATLKDAKMLDISETGVFYGTVEIEEGTIAGRFEGDMTVAGRLTIKATGVINGSITYKELAVEAGASIEGKLTPTNAKHSDKVATADFSKGKAAMRQAQSTPVTGSAPKANELPFGDKSSAG